MSRSLDVCEHGTASRHCSVCQHDQESLQQYLHDYKFRFVVNDLLNLIRSELKYDQIKYADPDDPAKSVTLHRNTLRVLRNKIVEFAIDNEVELD